MDVVGIVESKGVIYPQDIRSSVFDFTQKNSAFFDGVSSPKQIDLVGQNGNIHADILSNCCPVRLPSSALRSIVAEAYGLDDPKELKLVALRKEDLSFSLNGKEIVNHLVNWANGSPLIDNKNLTANDIRFVLHKGNLRAKTTTPENDCGFDLSEECACRILEHETSAAQVTIDSIKFESSPGSNAFQVSDVHATAYRGISTLGPRINLPTNGLN